MAVLVVGTALARLPLLRAPLSPDEAGFLMVGGQWSPGRSLYGDYWVDRPPGLIALAGLAQTAGGALALRLLGALAAAAGVLCAALLGRRLARGSRWAGPACAGLAAALVSSPLLSVREVNGEILALPLLLLGLWMLAGWLLDGGGWWAAGAGATAAAAASVKQNLVDVVIVAAVLGILAPLVRAPPEVAPGAGAGGWVAPRWREVLVATLWFTIGAGAVVVALLGLARSRGTDAAGLWDAVVTFRWDASRVIATESSAATGERAGGLAAAFVGTGAPLVLLLLALLPWRPHRAVDPAGVALTWAAVVLLVWEGFSAAVGGSYWLHYLIGLVPGLVLLLALALRALAPAPGAEAAGTTRAARAAGTAWVRRRRTAGAVLVALALAVVPVSTVAARVGVGLTPSGRPADEQAVIDFLRSHDDRARTGVVAFGSADVLRAAGLTSPYPYLWSLPVRVRDPGLLALDAVLRGTRRPSWILRQGASLDSWGIEATAADRIIGRRYRRVFTSGDWQVLELRPD